MRQRHSGFIRTIDNIHLHSIDNSSLQFLSATDDKHTDAGERYRRRGRKTLGEPRQREGDKERTIDIETERKREQERDTETHTERQTETERQRETERDIERQSEQGRIHCRWQSSCCRWISLTK